VATSGSEIVNPRTGQRTIFLQTAHDTKSALLQLATFHPAHGPAEPEHIHPFQESRCRVLAGTLRFRISGVKQTVKSGEAVTIPAGAPHYFWNDGEVEAHAVQEFRPALNSEDFFVTYFALARDNKLNEAGLPKSVLQLAVLMKAYDNAIRVTKPPRFLQHLVIWTLEPLGRLIGYGGTYT
jgi:quercetin dioxygenase-like cupin family protein